MTPSRETICNAVEQVLEAMCFREAEWLGPGTLTPPLVGAAIRFRGAGDACGELRVALSPELAAGMAADFLAVDGQELAPDETAATVLELANVVCGVALNTWKPESDFHLSVPRPLTDADTAAEWPHRFAVDGNADFAASLSFRDSSPKIESPESGSSSPPSAARRGDGAPAPD